MVDPMLASWLLRLLIIPTSAPTLSGHLVLVVAWSMLAGAVAGAGEPGVGMP